MVAPARAAHANDSGLTGGSTGSGVRTTAIGNSRRAPTSITPATAGAAGDRRLARVAASVEVAKNRAVRIPATRGGMLVGRSRRSAGLVRGEGPGGLLGDRPASLEQRTGDRRREPLGPVGVRIQGHAPDPATGEEARCAGGARRSAICSMNVSPSAPAPSSTHGVPPQASGQLAACVGGRGRAVARQVEHGEGQLEQVRAERRQPPDRLEHEAGDRRPRRPPASRSTSDRRRVRRRAAGRCRGRPPTVALTSASWAVAEGSWSARYGSRILHASAPRRSASAGEKSSSNVVVRPSPIVS